MAQPGTARIFLSVSAAVNPYMRSILLVWHPFSKRSTYTVEMFDESAFLQRAKVPKPWQLYPYLPTRQDLGIN